MFLAAGQVAAAISGKSWDDFIKERFFLPLGMSSSSTSTNDLEGVVNQAFPHVKNGQQIQKINWRNIDNIAPAGSINSNVVDMAQWVRLNLNQGKYNDKTLISETTIAEMQRPQFIISPEGEFVRYWKLFQKPDFFTYGLGWFIQSYREYKLVWHGGNIDGMSAQVAFLPAENIGIVVLSNLGANALPTVLPFALFDLYLGNAKIDWNSEGLKLRAETEQEVQTLADKQNQNHAENTKTTLPLEQYAGKYQSGIYGEAVVELESDALILRYGTGFLGDLLHWHFDTFQVQWRDTALAVNSNIVKMLITFNLNADAKVDGFNLPMLGTFKRAAETTK